MRHVNETEIACELDTHDLRTKHRGALRDYAFPGSETIINWLENDRRNFHGEWPGGCGSTEDGRTGCILPATHSGECAV
jgi:hypothetical protein